MGPHAGTDNGPAQDRPHQDIRYNIDDTKLRQLGWTPTVDWENGILATADWLVTTSVLLPCLMHTKPHAGAPKACYTSAAGYLSCLPVPPSQPHLSQQRSPSLLPRPPLVAATYRYRQHPRYWPEVDRALQGHPTPPARGCGGLVGPYTMQP